MRRGYAHEVSDAHGLDAQVAALTAHGCEELLVEREAGDSARLRLDEYLYNLRAGDEMVVVGLDVFARTTGKLAVILNDLLERGVAVRVLGPVPMTIDAGRELSAGEMLRILSRHDEIRMRQRFRADAGEGRNARRFRLDEARSAEALERFRSGESLASIARAFGVDRRVVDAALSGARRRGENFDRDGKVRLRRTLLGLPAFDVVRPARSDESGDGA